MVSEKGGGNNTLERTPMPDHLPTRKTDERHRKKPFWRDSPHDVQLLYACRPQLFCCPYFKARQWEATSQAGILNGAQSIHSHFSIGTGNDVSCTFTTNMTTRLSESA